MYSSGQISYGHRKCPFPRSASLRGQVFFSGSFPESHIQVFDIRG